MIEAHKDNWWAEKPKPVPVKRLGWRPIDPYCTQTVPYYDLTRHYAGHRTDKSGNAYGVGPIDGYSPPDGEMLQRRDAQGNIREEDFLEGFIRPAFLEDDIVASTIPLNKLKNIRARFHMIKELLFVPSIHTPNMYRLDIRGNRTWLGNLNMYNCKNLEHLVISECYIDSVVLPPTGPDDVNNKFAWAYTGDFWRPSWGPRATMPPISVVDAVTRRAYYSRLSHIDEPRADYKQLSNTPGNGHLIIDGIHMHRDLINIKNWRVTQLSVQSFDLKFNAAGSTIDYDFMTSFCDWNIQFDVDWARANQYSGAKSDNEQRVQITVDPNTTGSSRVTIMRIRKIKRYPHSTSRQWEDGTEFHHHAEIKITQNG